MLCNSRWNTNLSEISHLSLLALYARVQGETGLRRVSRRTTASDAVTTQPVRELSVCPPDPGP